jgi:hypothetical protein
MLENSLEKCEAEIQMQKLSTTAGIVSTSEKS